MTIESDRSKDGTSLNQGDVEERIVPLCDPPILFSLPSLNKNSQHDGFDVAEGEKVKTDPLQNHLPMEGLNSLAQKTNKVVNSTESNLRWGVESVSGQSRPTSEPVELNHTGPVSDSATEHVKRPEITSLSEANDAEARNTESSTIKVSSSDRADASPSKHEDPTKLPLTDSVPAGRTWMEQVGSHGIVIGLLLSVIAAALLTGRDRDQSSSEQVDLLSFDRNDLQLPLPEVFEIDLGQPEGGLAANKDPSNPQEELEQHPDRDLFSINSKTPDNPSSNAVESMQPRSGKDAEVEEIAVASLTADENQTGESQAENDPLPSLEQLAGGSGDLTQDTHIHRVSSEKPKETTTPKAIDNWLMFLPAMESIATGTDNPPTSIK
ncbi:MAG: hypothetical protein VYB72_08445 [Planctomycetota bacterium]|nr:hypothetical protein [Planctomycetota bacterium]